MTEVSRLPTARPPMPAHTFADLERMATAVASSKLFGVRTPDEALSLMLLAQAEGRHPAIAARDYHVIEGRPALKADTMLARFQEAGGRVTWHELTDQRVAATFAHPAGGEFRCEWTIDTATRAGLAGKSIWQKYPRAMLRSRVISEAVRTILPSVIVGTYTPEEIADGDVEIRAVVTPATPPEVQAPADVPATVAASATGEVTDAEIVTTLTPQQVSDYTIAIAEAKDKPALIKAYNAAYRAAGAVKDSASVAHFKAARDERLAEIAK